MLNIADINFKDYTYDSDDEKEIVKKKNCNDIFSSKNKQTNLNKINEISFKLCELKKYDNYLSRELYKLNEDNNLFKTVDELEEIYNIFSNFLKSYEYFKLSIKQSFQFIDENINEDDKFINLINNLYNILLVDLKKYNNIYETKLFIKYDDIIILNLFEISIYEKNKYYFKISIIDKNLNFLIGERNEEIELINKLENCLESVDNIYNFFESELNNILSIINYIKIKK